MPTRTFDELRGRGKGWRQVTHEVYRGFVFARLAADGDRLCQEYFGASLSSIDYMADRSPEGEMEVAGGVLRYTHDSATGRCSSRT